MTRRPHMVMLHAAYASCLWRGFRRFQRQARTVYRTQQRLLRETVSANADTAYGRAHGFQRIDSVAAFRRRVPVVDYAAIAPWIDRVANGEQQVLTTEPVRMMERTGGSTSANKLIPYTDGLLAQLCAATGPWQFDLLARRPKLAGTCSYWSLSPVARTREHTEGGLPIGFEDDTVYFGRVERWALGQMMAVPAHVAKLPNIAAWRHETCWRLLAAGDLGLISVWSPTFLTLLMEHMEAHLDTLLADVPADRAKHVRSVVGREGGLRADRLWPHLQVVSCWCDGPSKALSRRLDKWFAGVEVQPKGLLATEGVVSFPLWGHPGAVAAVGSHFLEFIDLEHPARPPVLVHELRENARYSPVMSTAGGLYRYQLQDMVQCVGHHADAPLLRFVEKLDRVSDLCGEKVHAEQVGVALAQASTELGVQLEFAMLAPVEGSPARYRLYIESAADDADLQRVARNVEAHLAAGHHYRYCRDLGQLDALDYRRVARGWQTYQHTLAGLGQRLGDIKPTCLDTRAIWDRAFTGEPGAEVTPELPS